MGHVNNAAYIDYVEEALLASGDAAVAAMRALPRRVRIEYVQAAVPQSVLDGAAWRHDDADGEGWAWRLTDPAGDRDITRAGPGGSSTAAVRPRTSRRRRRSDAAR